nr:restriction endonuclease subunit S [uncultured Clostridium sp.]
MERNVPKLRFKGFNDEWHKKSLREISTYINRTENNNVNITDILTISAGKGFMNQKDRFSQVIAGNSLKKYTLLYRNEFSYNRGNSKKYTYGCIYKLDNYEKALVPNVYISFKINNQVDDFYKQLFIKKYLDKYLRRLISSSTRMDGLLNINKEDFFDIEVPVPMIEEQEKIANFLTKVDKIIEKQEEKVKNLENYKKGMMQKIFSQEIRFKDENGEDYPEWEEKCIGEISNVITGNTPPTKESNNFGEEYLWASPIDLGNSKYIDDTKTRLSSTGFNKVRKIQKGSVLVTCIGSTIGKIGIAATEMSSNQQINSVYSDTNDNEYIYYYLEYNFKKYLSYISFQAVPIINKSQFEQLNIDLPCIEEQRKIVNLLGKVDMLAEKEKVKLGELKLYKKGLLQQMFI